MNHEDVVDILLVEDDLLDAQLVTRALAQVHLGDRILVLSDGAEAIDFIRGRGRHASRPTDRPPKLVVLDLKLPKVSGLDVLRELKSVERLRAVPVVVLTSAAADPDVVSAYEAGANSYVVKPLDAPTFQEAVSSLGSYWLLVNQVPGQ
jgi:two-component system, response regulator